MLVTKAEEQFFEALQEMFAEPCFLAHFDSKRRPHIDLNASRQQGFGAMIYHVTGDPETNIPRTAIQSIMFLFKLLSSVETRYWPTEFEVAGLVWIIRKTRHMVEAVRKTTIILTDHSATPFIARQTKLISSSTETLNLRLIRASRYLSQFELDIRYKPRFFTRIKMVGRPRLQRRPPDRDRLVLQPVHLGRLRDPRPPKAQNRPATRSWPLCRILWSSFSTV